MIKKFISNTLLSVVMDKKARNALEASKAKKEGRTLAKKKAASTAGKKSSVNQNVKLKVDPEKLVNDLERTLDASPPPPSEELSRDEQTALINQTLESARHELETKAKMSPERRALIEQAMTIRNQQAHILDDLSVEQREKLAAMALYTFDPEGKFKGGKE